MNDLAPHDGRFPRATQAAEGLLRRAWTVDEIERIVAAGIIPDDERFELIGGEVVPMSPEGVRHEILKIALNRHWCRTLPDTIEIAQETTFRLDPLTFLEPDFVFYPRDVGIAGLSPLTALLVVEIADTSLRFDLDRKIAVYAAAKVREVWIVNAQTLETTVHRFPSADSYATIGSIAPDTPLVPDFAPEAAVTLADLDLR